MSHFSNMLENLRMTARMLPQAKQQQQEKEDTPSIDKKNDKIIDENKIHILKPSNTVASQRKSNNKDDFDISQLKQTKRLSVTATTMRERKQSVSNVILEINNSEKPLRRELSPTRKMSQDFRSRAGSFLFTDEDGGGRNMLMRKPIRLKNIEGRLETFDTLHCKGRETLSCSKSTCMSSIMHLGSAPIESRKSDVVLDHARDFLDQYFTSIKRASSEAHKSRWQQVRQSIESTGQYQLTETELIYGAKLAWRNSSRCIGRIQWSKLQVFYTWKNFPEFH